MPSVGELVTSTSGETMVRPPSTCPAGHLLGPGGYSSVMCPVRGGELADFAHVGQSAFCQGWQLCVKNALSLGRIITTWGRVLMSLSMMWVSLRLLSLAQ
jgi:hypothetical protein